MKDYDNAMLQEELMSDTETSEIVHRTRKQDSVAQVEQMLDMFSMPQVSMKKQQSLDSLRVVGSERSESHLRKREETLMNMLIETQRKNKTLEEDNQNLMYMNLDLEQRVSELEELANTSMEMCTVLDGKLSEMQLLSADSLELKEEIKRLNGVLLEKDKRIKKLVNAERSSRVSTLSTDDLFLRPSVNSL